MSRVLVIGLARSGTTWVGQALSGAEGTCYVDEPDNHYRHPAAFRAKAKLSGRAYPALLGGDDAAPEYAALWRSAFGLDAHESYADGIAARARQRLAGRLHRGVLPPRLRRAPMHVRRTYAGGRASPGIALAARLGRSPAPDLGTRDVVVKSVYAARSACWLARLLPARVLVLRRDLRGLVASWKGAGWLGDPAEDFLDELGPGGGEALAAEVGASMPDSGLTQIGRVTWLLACLSSRLRAATASHPDWAVASYEELTGDAARSLPRLAADLELQWSAAASAQLRGPLAPPHRPAGIDPRLSAAEAEEIAAVLTDFDLAGWAW